MDVTMKKMEITKLSFEKTTWEVKNSMTVTINNEVFVKLPKFKPTCCGFAKMCCKGTAGDISLIASEGYRLLVQLRNQAQSLELESDLSPQKALPSQQTSLKDLFQRQQGIGGDEAPQKRPRKSREECRELRSCPQTILISIPAFDGFPEMTVPVLRPVHPRDVLTVPFKEDTRREHSDACPT